MPGTYGWKKDPEDQRDHVLGIGALPLVGRVLPEQVDMRTSAVPEPYDQGALSSCTAQAIAGLLEYDAARRGIVNTAHPSRLMLYYEERLLAGWPDKDIGAYIRDGFKVLAAAGVCPESEWPYDHLDTRVNLHPPEESYLNRVAFAGLHYQRVPQDSVSLKTCLASGFPFVFGFLVYPSFESSEVAQTGIVPMPAAGEQVIGGHAVVSLGYGAQGFLCRNSWGTNWGLEGHFWIPEAYVTDPARASDFWEVSAA